MPSGLRGAIEECWRPKRQFGSDRATRDELARRFIPFSSQQLVVSGRFGAVKGAPSARRSGPLTARIDLPSFGGRERGFQRARAQAPTTNPEDPQRKRHSLALKYGDQFSPTTGGRAIRASGGRLTCFAHLRKTVARHKEGP